MSVSSGFFLTVTMTSPCRDNLFDWKRTVETAKGNSYHGMQVCLAGKWPSRRLGRAEFRTGHKRAAVNILQVNQADVAGGAETIARSLHEGLRKRGHQSTLAVSI